MGIVAKYNTFKGVSTALTVGTPIVTLLSCSELFVHRSDTAISAAGIFALLLGLFAFKDKIVEKFKMPSALILSICVLIFVCLIENIILPVKYISISTAIASGIDELTFKRLYKNIERKLPNEATFCKHIGFIFGTTSSILGDTNES